MLALLALLLGAGPALSGQPDRDPPAIEHEALARAARGAPIEIRAVISDRSGVFGPLVFARTAGGRRYSSWPLEDRGGGEFFAALPASLLSAGAFEYFLEAYDEVGNGPARAGSPERPFRVAAYDAPPQPARLIVRTDPPDAAIDVDGQPQKSDAAIELQPGRHAIDVTAPGRRPSRSQIELAAGRETRLYVSLSEGRGSGTLRVSSDPPGAHVLLDGVRLGVTPYAGPLVAGAHRLAVEMAGRLRQERAVTFEAGSDVEQAFALPVLPRGPALSVESEPPGALLVIDGADKGRTPWVGPIAPGAHTAVLRMQGRREQSTEFQMPAGRDLSLRLSLPVEVEKGPPQLVVGSTPAGATLLVDGEDAGVTPWSGTLPAGKHALELRLDGFQPQKRDVTVADGRDVEATFQLVRKPGPAQIAIESDPPGAELTIDGKAVGQAPWSGELKPGEHQIAAMLAGRREVSQQLAVEAGQKASLRLSLPEAAAVAAPTLLVNTQPQGAQVQLDGKPLGDSPARGKLAPGAHVLKVLMDGYHARTAKFAVPENRDVQLVFAVALKPLRESVEARAPDKVQLARARLNRGRACYQTGDFACAAAEYTAAYELKPVPELLFNVAQAQRRGGRFAEAASTYRAFLREAPKATAAKEAGRLAKLCDELAVKNDAPKAEAAEDTQPPLLAHDPVRSTARGEPLRLRAAITDDKSGISSPQACVRNLYAPDWECLPLTAAEGDRFEVAVPARLIADGLSYYLEAYDNAGNGPARAGTPEKPLSVAVVDEAPAVAATAAATAPPTKTIAAAVPAGLAHPDQGFRATRRLGWLAVGTGAAALAAGGAFALSARNLTRGDQASVVNGVTIHTITQQNAQRAADRNATSWLLFGVGGALTAAGAGFLWVMPDASGGVRAGASTSF